MKCNICGKKISSKLDAHLATEDHYQRFRLGDMSVPIACSSECVLWIEEK